MKKSLVPPAVQDQCLPPCKIQGRRSAKPQPLGTRLGPTPLGKRPATSYVPGEKARKEPRILPRLFIQGHGGSIKLDLDGVGVGLSEAVFAHLVADDSLLSLHVCRGDIALIEPAVRSFHDGNLVLLEIDGRAVIRRLRKVRRLWMLDPIDRKFGHSLLLHEHGIQGFVIGFMRLLNKLRPVRYEGTDANYGTGFEKHTPQSNRPARRKSRELQKRGQRENKGSGTTPILPSADKAKSLFSLSEIDKMIRYKAWPDK